jgi:hypothetical protein
MGKDNLKHGQQCAIHDVSCRYFDMNGREVKEGDTIRFTLYDGIPNKEFVVRKDEKMNEFGIDGLYPPTMKYLEFVIVDNGN